jgi:hypothetical protein
MHAIISIDTMSQRYGYLPSELLSKASTFDLWICNEAMRFQQTSQAEAQGDFSHLNEEDLLAMKNNV